MSTRPLWKDVKAEIRCPSAELIALASPRRIERFDRLLCEIGLSMVCSQHHVFPNFGLTYVAILSESHLALHTWPEFDLMVVDAFFCSPVDEKTVQVRIASIAESVKGSVDFIQVMSR